MTIIILIIMITTTTIPGDKRIGEKENEKVEKYQKLKREIARMWNMRTVQMIPIYYNNNK